MGPSETCRRQKLRSITNTEANHWRTCLVFPFPEHGLLVGSRVSFLLSN